MALVRFWCCFLVWNCNRKNHKINQRLAFRPARASVCPVFILTPSILTNFAQETIQLLAV